jgi:uncharacterized repeat protein (TIGR01451 family)
MLLAAVGIGGHALVVQAPQAQAVALPDLTVSKTVFPTADFFAGDPINYNIDVSNVGGPITPSTAQVRVMDRLPAGFSYLYAIPTAGSCSFNPRNPPDVSCEIPASALAAGPVQIAIGGDLPRRLPGNKMITNQVEVNPQRTIRESNYNNNRAQVTIPVMPLPLVP